MDDQPVRVFDVTRILWGAQPATYLLEVAVRTAVMYLFALALVRVLGKRGISELTPFEYIIIIAMGSAVGDPMFYPNIPVLHSMVVLAVIVALQSALLRATAHSRKLEKVVKGTARLLVEDGCLKVAQLESESLTREELFMALRESGVSQLGQIRRAYLEPSGAVSIFRAKTEKRQGLSILPHRSDDPLDVATGAHVPRGGSWCCKRCGAPHAIAADEAAPACRTCGPSRFDEASDGLE